METALKDAPALEALLDKYSSGLSKELADEVYSILTQDYTNGQKARAAAASRVMGEIYSRLGMQYESLYSFLESLVIQFEVADILDYPNLSKASHNISIDATKLGVYNLAFWGDVLAADCALQAYRSLGQSTKNRYLIATLQELVNAARIAPQYVIQRLGDVKGIWFDRFIRVTEVSINDATLKQLFEKKNPETNELLSQLSIALGLLVPILFVLTVRTNSRAYKLADILTQLPLPFSTAAVLSSVALYLKSSIFGVSPKQLADLRLLMSKQAYGLRTQFRSRAGRLWVSQELDLILCEPLKDMLKGGSSDTDVFEMIESLKSRLLLDYIGGKFLDFSKDELTEKVADLERRVLGFKPDGHREASGLPIFRQEDNKSQAIADMIHGSLLSIGTIWDRADRWNAMRSVENFYSNYDDAGFKGVEQVSGLFDVMEALEQDEALIEYCIPYHPTEPASKLWIVVVTSSDVRIIPATFWWNPEVQPMGVTSSQDGQPVDVSPLGVMVSGLNDEIGIGNDEEAQQILQKLYQVLISPLIKNGFSPQKFRHWIIIPSGILHYLPFAALADSNNRKLIEDVTITVVPSASVWHKLQAHRKQPVRSFLGFANPVLSYATNLPSLKQAEEELTTICQSLRKLNCTPKVREDASEETLHQEIIGKDIIHIATHGEFPESNTIDFHNILLSATSKHDGRLHAEEIRRMDLHSARLVVLSICNGGLIRFGPGDEPYGLVPAFLTAGAENVMGTLWPLENDIGRDFMIEFYTHLLSNGPAGALQLACKSFIEKDALIRHWAGFELVGSGRPFH